MELRGYLTAGAKAPLVQGRDLLAGYYAAAHCVLMVVELLSELQVLELE